MLSILRGLGYESIVYGLGGMVTKIVGFVLLPVLSRHLLPDEYGVYSLLLVTAALVAVVAQAGLGGALFYEVIYREVDEQVATASSLALAALASSALLVVLLPLAPAMSAFLLGETGHASLVRLAIVGAVLTTADVVYRAKLRMHGRALQYSGFTLARALTFGGLSLLAVVRLGLGVRGLIQSYVLTELVFAAIYVILMVPDLRAGARRALIDSLARYGLPLVPGGLAALLMTYADRYFLRHYGSTWDVGVYAAGYSIGIALSVGVQAVQVAWAAWLFTIVRREDARFLFGRIVTYYTLAFGFFALVLSVLAPEALRLLVDSRYWAAYVVVPFVSVAYVLNGIRALTNAGIMTTRRTYLVSVAVVFGLAVNTAVNILLIPRYGMVGAAVATLVGYAALLALQLAFNMRLYPISLEYGRLLKLGLIWGAVFALAVVPSFPEVWQGVLWKVVLLALFVPGLAVVGFFRRDELAAAAAALRRSGAGA